MLYNPNIHHRRSIRLKNYDYSREGLYFVTICVQNKLCLFGEIVDSELRLNEAGQMIEKWWFELANKFPDIDLGAYVIMPNHFHGIIRNSGCGNPNIEKNANNAATTIIGTNLCAHPKNSTALVGAHLCVRPDENSTIPVGADLCVCPPNNIAPVGADLCVCPNENTANIKQGAHTGAPLHGCHNTTTDEHAGSPLSGIVQWFKTMTTNEYIRNVKTLNWQPFEKRLWQRNYHEHIIRTSESQDEIENYIFSNPRNWLKDSLFHL